MNKKSSRNILSDSLASLRPAAGILQKNDPLRLAAATAFFTAFALPAIVFILIQFIGLFTSRRTIGRAMIERIANTLGDDGASQVRDVLRSIVGFHASWYILIVGFLFLIFVSTTLFNVIRHSLNELWQIKISERPGIGFMVTSRARSLGLILLAGILFLADLFSESLRMVAGKYIEAAWKQGAIYLNGFLNEIVSLLIVCAWFTLLFRFLGDGRPKWKAAFAGGLLTGILFKAGKILLWYLLVNSGMTKFYGASGSLALVMLFVFYSSIIFYYGACFVYSYSERAGLPIRLVGKVYSPVNPQPPAPKGE